MARHNVCARFPGAFRTISILREATSTRPESNRCAPWLSTTRLWEFEYLDIETTMALLYKTNMHVGSTPVVYQSLLSHSSALRSLEVTSKDSWLLRPNSLIDWCCFYYFRRNSLEVLLQFFLLDEASQPTKMYTFLHYRVPWCVGGQQGLGATPWVLSE